MKKLQILGAIAIIGLAQACAVNRYEVLETNEHGIQTCTKLTQYIFLQKAALDGVKVSPKTGFSLKAANSETQNDVIESFAKGALEGAVKGAKLVP